MEVLKSQEELGAPALGVRKALDALQLQTFSDGVSNTLPLGFR
jgi:hypothetical protein